MWTDGFYRCKKRDDARSDSRRPDARLLRTGRQQAADGLTPSGHYITSRMGIGKTDGNFPINGQKQPTDCLFPYNHAKMSFIKGRSEPAGTDFPTFFSKGSVSGTAILTSFCRSKQGKRFHPVRGGLGRRGTCPSVFPGMNRYGLDRHFHFS